MSGIRRFHSWRQWRARLLSASCPGGCASPSQVRRLCAFARKLICGLTVLAGAAAHAQHCPIQPAYPPPPSKSQTHASEAAESTLHRDLRSSIAAQKSGAYQDTKLFQKRILSKEDLQELRRVVREHARSSRMHAADDNAYTQEND